MQGIIDTLTTIGEAISSVIDFVVKFFMDIVYIVELTGKFVLQIPSYFTWLPSQLVTLLVTIFAIVVIYKISGREG